jgi:hypothetical protein
MTKMTIDFPGPDYFVVVVRYGRSPVAVFASGLFFHEAQILKRHAIAKGYKDAQIKTEEDIGKARKNKHGSAGVTGEASRTGRLLYDLRTFSRGTLA